MGFFRTDHDPPDLSGCKSQMLLVYFQAGFQSCALQTDGPANEIEQF
jgi:hypothetical protein